MPRAGTHEGARERDLQRYYQPWLEAFHASSLPPLNHDSDSGHVPQSSGDHALTAFAQLGALRLGAKRGVVTLIDSKYQYILAESTRSLSLLDDNIHAAGDELWLGNALIPRGQGVSEDALFATPYTAHGPGDQVYTAPALVVPDITKHERYTRRGFAGHGVFFYAGVPIVTRLGHSIGVYVVSDDKPRDGLSADELRLMVDMATICLNHLETIRNERARARGERLIQGIGTFIEGHSIEHSLTDSPSIESDARKTSPLDQAGAKSKSERPPLHRNKPSSSTFKGMLISNANTVARQQYPSQDCAEGDMAEHTIHVSSNAVPKSESTPAPSTNQHELPHQKKSQHSEVFDRAAKILRKCMAADGVVILDASAANLGKGTARLDRRSGGAAVKHDRQKSKESPKDHSSPTGALPPRAVSGDVQSPSDDQQPNQSRNCDVIATAMRETPVPANFRLSEHDLRKLVRHHAQGNCFSFDEDGILASSDESSGSAVSPAAVEKTQMHDSEVTLNTHQKKTNPKTNSLQNALPGARTIVFLPLWDFAKERWDSAAVIWSSSRFKLIHSTEDLSYLTAFGNSIMNEIARLNLAASDTAKATFLANISHELRSPLHGILGSIEFLHDTNLDDFQSNMVISVETCGKTLLDTVNHVLDFAKLTNLSKRQLKQDGVVQSTTSGASLTTNFDLATVVEEAVEAVYAGQVFRSVTADALQGVGPSSSSSNREIARREDRKAQIAEGQAIAADAVRLTLNIDGETNWRVTSQPGAVRRIVMNLLGNSLKYTEQGSIDVSLEVDRSHEHENDHYLYACINVRDTGRGMSEDFVRNHAFTAFSQENSLTAGTGLGLSIVRQIVDSLGGKIDMRSQKDMGTETRIWLSLPAPTNEQDAPDAGNDTLHQIQEMTRGLKTCFLQPSRHHSTQPPPALQKMPTVEDSMRHVISQWFSMEVISASSMQDIVADFFLYAEPPAIEYLIDEHGQHGGRNEIPTIILCQNAYQANSLRADGIHLLTDIGRILEVIAQPVGPQKLAKVLSRCMQRMKKLEDVGEAFSSSHVTLSLSPNDKLQNRDAYASSGKPGTSTILTVDGHRRSMPKSAPRPSLQPLQPSVNDSLPRVLVVDDNEINLRLLLAFVRKTKHPYESATDGIKAVEAYKNSHQPAEASKPVLQGGRIRYILMDIGMPNMDGIAATKEIRKFEKENNLPPAKIFALTGMAQEGGMGDQIAEAGFDEFLSKPAKFRDLSKLLE